jgi:hypothetical protein
MVFECERQTCFYIIFTVNLIESFFYIILQYYCCVLHFHSFLFLATLGLAMFSLLVLAIILGCIKKNVAIFFVKNNDCLTIIPKSHFS